MPLVADYHIEVAVAVHVRELEVLRSRFAVLRPALPGRVAKVRATVVEQHSVDSHVADQKIRSPVTVQVEHGEGIGHLVRPEPHGRVREPAGAVVYIELVATIVLAHEDEIEIAVAIEVGKRNVLAVVRRARHPVRGVREPPAPVVDKQDIGLKFHREHEVEVAVAVHVAGSGIHAGTREPCRQIGRRDIAVRRRGGPDARQREPRADREQRACGQGPSPRIAS